MALRKSFLGILLASSILGMVGCTSAKVSSELDTVTQSEEIVEITDVEKVVELEEPVEVEALEEEAKDVVVNEKFDSFVERYEKLESKFNEIDLMQATETTADYGGALIDFYENEVDKLLNEIYQELKATMKEDEFNKLKSEQIEWVKNKEYEVEKTQNEGGRYFHVINKQYFLTHERIGELLKYMDNSYVPN